jgi:hypothetical protein
MAKYYGQSSKYSLKLSKKFTYMILGGAGILLLLSLILRLVNETEIAKFIVIGIILLIVPAVLGVIKLAQKQLDKVDRGENGEKDIRSLLINLPDGYHVFEDVTVNRFGNIDFVVVGPTGTFAIEVKSHKGSLGYRNGELLDYGRRFEKNFLKQAWSEKKGLEEYLRSKKIHTNVNAVLVFTKAHVRFNGPLRGVTVIDRWGILPLLDKRIDNPPEYNKIVEAIAQSYK